MRVPPAPPAQAVPGQDEVHIGVGVGHLGEGVDQHVEALLRDEPPDAEDVGAFPPLGIGRPHPGQVGAVAHHPSLRRQALAESRHRLVDDLLGAPGDHVGVREKAAPHPPHGGRALVDAVGVHGELALQAHDEREPQAPRRSVGVVTVAADALDVDQPG